MMKKKKTYRKRIFGCRREVMWHDRMKEAMR